MFLFPGNSVSHHKNSHGYLMRKHTSHSCGPSLTLGWIPKESNQWVHIDCVSNPRQNALHIWFCHGTLWVIWLTPCLIQKASFLDILLLLSFTSCFASWPVEKCSDSTLQGRILIHISLWQLPGYGSPKLGIQGLVPANSPTNAVDKHTVTRTWRCWIFSRLPRTQPQSGSDGLVGMTSEGKPDSPSPFSFLL
jgi:hypothetical protein